jgi:hypothetical protein
MLLRLPLCALAMVHQHACKQHMLWDSGVHCRFARWRCMAMALCCTEACPRTGCPLHLFLSGAAHNGSRAQPAP